MKKRLSGLILLSVFAVSNAQIGINTSNPQGVFNIDAAKDNPSSGVLSAAQQKDDFVILPSGSVGIGTTAPDASAILELNVSGQTAGSQKGFLMPRVALASLTDITTIPSPAKGLVVYNLGTQSTFTYEGYVFWNGTEWRSLDNSSTSNAAISSLDCSNATLNPATFTAGIAYNGYITVPYFDGNGAKYNQGSPIVSTGNTGLTATLQSGTLAFGNGNLVYKVSGIPLQSSPNIASFNLGTTVLGAPGCIVSVGTAAATGVTVKKLIYSSASPISAQVLNIGDMVFRFGTSGTDWVVQMALSNSVNKNIYVGMNQQFDPDGFQYKNWVKSYTTANYSTFQNIATDTSNVIVNTELNIFHIVDIQTNSYYRVTYYVSGPSGAGNKAFVIVAEKF